MKITSQLNAPGELTSHILPELTAIHIGTMNGNADAIVTAQLLVDYWCKGGLKAEYHDNINDFIWGKAVNNIAINSACAIARLNIGSFYRSRRDGLSRNNVFVKLLQLPMPKVLS